MSIFQALFKRYIQVFGLLILVLLTGYTFFKLYIFVLKEDNSYCLQSLIHFRFRIIAFSAIAEMLREGSADVFKHFRNRYFINAMRWFNGVCEIFRSCVNTSGCYNQLVLYLDNSLVVFSGSIYMTVIYILSDRFVHLKLIDQAFGRPFADD